MATRAAPGGVKMPNEQGPPLQLKYYSKNVDDKPRVARLASGASNPQMAREDMLMPEGWRDGSVYNYKTRKWEQLLNAQGKATLAPVGVSRWDGRGPNISANRNCLDCHVVSKVDTDVALSGAWGPVEAFAVKRLVSEGKMPVAKGKSFSVALQPDTPPKDGPDSKVEKAVKFAQEFREVNGLFPWEALEESRRKKPELAPGESQEEIDRWNREDAEADARAEKAASVSEVPVIPQIKL